MKLICKQVINELLGGEVDFAKVQRLIPRDKGFAPADTRAALAAMNFVLRNASVYSVSDEVLNRELQQLGLPKENSDGISRPFRNNRDLLVEFHSKLSLSVSAPCPASLGCPLRPGGAARKRATTCRSFCAPLILAASPPKDRGVAGRRSACFVRGSGLGGLRVAVRVSAVLAHSPPVGGTAPPSCKGSRVIQSVEVRC